MKSGWLWGQQGPPVFTRGLRDCGGLEQAMSGGLCVGSATTGIRLKRGIHGGCCGWRRLGQPRANASSLLNFRNIRRICWKGGSSVGLGPTSAASTAPVPPGDSAGPGRAGGGCSPSHTLDDLWCVVGREGER